MNRTHAVGVYGTDLGSMFLHSDGRVYFLFGDTFGPPGQPAHSRAWRSNAMAFSTDHVPSDGITFDGWITNVNGLAKPLIQGRHDPNDSGGEVTKIPTYGWSDGRRQFMWYMSVECWCGPGRWDVNHARIAFSDDSGNTWSLSHAQWPPKSNFIQVATAEHEGYRLFWGIPAGRWGGVKLARVRPQDVLEPAAYQYYAGSGWGSSESDAATVVPAPVGEISVLWNPFLRRWLMTYLNEGTARIEVREALEPWGPWSDPWELLSAARFPTLYGAYMHPRFTENDGETVYLLTSRFDVYNVFLFKAVFERQ